jgi:hypothetical protein
MLCQLEQGEKKMSNTLPDEGEWILTAAGGQPLPPFVKLSVYFDCAFGFVQGMNRTQQGCLSKVTRIAGDRFGALFQIGAVKGQFEAKIKEEGDLQLTFLAPQRTTVTARPLQLDRDAVVRRLGVPAARALVAQFGARTTRGAFPNITREALVISLLKRIDQPESINQGMTNMCGPAAFMFTFAKHDIAAYTKFVIDLYERGDATIGTLRVTPSSAFCFDHMPWQTSSPADWIALGSIRDSSNWFFQYHTNELPFFNAGTRSDSPLLTWEGIRGGTTAGDVTSWLKNMGYTSVVNESNLVFCSTLDNLRQADARYRNGEKVCLLVCANFLDAKTRKEAADGGRADHFIVLASPIEIGAEVHFTLYTWGSFRPLGFRLTPEEFLNSYYGYIAARR